MPICNVSMMNAVFIYDVFWENPAYQGTNNAFLDQPFSYIFIHRLFLNCAENERKMFSADAHMGQKVQSLIRRHTERAALVIAVLCSSMSRVFADEVTCMDQETELLGKLWLALFINAVIVRVYLCITVRLITIGILANQTTVMHLYRHRARWVDRAF